MSLPNNQVFLIQVIKISKLITWLIFVVYVAICFAIFRSLQSYSFDFLCVCGSDDANYSTRLSVASPLQVRCYII